MAKYRIPEKSFIDNRIVEAGEVIDYDGENPGSEWKKLTVKELAKKAADEEPGGGVDPLK